MTNKVINFSDLGRTEVRCIIYTDEFGVVKAEYSQEGIKRLQNSIENPIIVYNTNPETQIKLQTIVGTAGNGVYKDKKNIVVTAKELILDYLPLCTNIVLNLDAEIDKEKIQEIINDPNKEFEMVINEVGKIVYESSKTYADNITAFAKLSKEEREKILEESQSEIVETEEEKELRELEEKTKLLKEKIKNQMNEIIEENVEIIEAEEIVKTEE